MSEKPRILVVDDEPIVVDSARRLLTAEGYPVVTAGDAESALEIVQREQLEIVVTDLMLPGLSGMEFLEAVHEQDPNKAVIITTGYSTVDYAIASLRMGAFDFLPKPFTFEELLSQIHRAVRFINLPPGVRSELEPTGVGNRRFLGLHTWACIQEDGSSLTGLARPFLLTVDRIESVEFPEPGDDVRQGGRLIRCTTADALVHEVWSPLSGQVLSINSRVVQAPDLLHEDPHGVWVVRILPTALQKELANLTVSGRCPEDSGA